MGAEQSRSPDHAENVNISDDISKVADDTHQTSYQTGSARNVVDKEYTEAEESTTHEETDETLGNVDNNIDDSGINNVLENDVMELNNDGTSNMESGWNILSRVKTAINQFGTWRNTGLYDDVKTEEPVRNFNNNVEDTVSYNDINIRYRNGLTPLTSAIRSGSLDRVISILQHPDVNVELREIIPYKLGNYREPPRSPLIVAILEGQRDMVKLLLEAGADVNTTDEEQYSALYHAVNDNHVDIVKLLLEYDVSICTDDTYKSPLYIACQHNRLEVIKLLLSSGYKLDESHSSLLPVAIESMAEEIALHLIEMGVPLTSNDKIKEPLISACQYGHLSIVEACVEAGCDINMKLDNGVSPLQAAVKLCNFQWDRTLLYGKCSERPSQLTPQVKNILKQRQKIVDLLCSKGCSLNDTLDTTIKYNHTRQKSSALAIALRCDNLPCVYVLLKHGAQWNDECHQNLLKCCENWSQNIYNDSYIELIMQTYLSQIILMLKHSDRMRYINKINQQNYTPSSLKQNCRHVIRDQLMKRSNTTILPHISMLNLPKLLQQYLCFEDFNELENCLT